jgi:hypothetical protein
VKTRHEPVNAAAHPIQGRQLRAAVLRDTKDFVSLREEWDDLYNSCLSATPFSSWEWLYSWWEVYGGAYDLRLVTLRNHRGLLVGLLPLMVRRRPSFGRLLLIGDDPWPLYWYVVTPYKDVLVREGWEESAALAGARALMEMSGWRVADLQELTPEAAAWGLFRHWEGPKVSLPITDYVIIRAGSWEELLSSVSRNLRSIARRTLRRAEEDGLRCEPAGTKDAERAARTLVNLHRDLLQERRIDPEDLTPRFEAFMQTAARRMTARRIGRISEFRREDGEVLASQFLVFDKDFVGVYVLGAHEKASRRYQFMTLCNRDAFTVAHSKGSAYVSWMHYVSQDKLRWATEVASSHRTILGRKRTSSWAPYAGYHFLRERYYALRSGVQVYIHSEDAPRWVKRATQRYYALMLFPHSEVAPAWVKSATRSYYALRARFGYGWLRYRLELARARRQIGRSNASRKY